jgi:hypothetical protein
MCTHPAISTVAKWLDIHPATDHLQIGQADADQGGRPGSTAAVARSHRRAGQEPGRSNGI